jgi:hypothetical protein
VGELHQVGVAVECTVCHLHKKPRGRDAAPAAANGLCDMSCPGYAEDPQVGELWPGERRHAAWCEAEAGHDHDCAPATELARLRAFATAVRDEFVCVLEGEERPEDHVDDCWRCYAEQAMERVG